MDIISDSNIAATATCPDTDTTAAQHIVAINSSENKEEKDDINKMYNFMNTMTTLLGKIVDKKESHDVSQATLDKFQNQMEIIKTVSHHQVYTAYIQNQWVTLIM